MMPDESNSPSENQINISVAEVPENVPETNNKKGSKIVTAIANALLILSAIPAVYIFFSYFLVNLLCKPHEDLLVGAGGVCTFYSIVNFVTILVPMFSLVFTGVGLVLLIVAISIYFKKGLLKFSDNKVRLIIILLIVLQYILYLGLYRAITSWQASRVSHKIESQIISENVNDPWEIFDKFNVALKDKDVQTANALLYRSPKQMRNYFKDSADFEEMYRSYTKKINKDNFVNKWQDDKQAIYSTNDWGRIMFVKQNGLWKILVIDPRPGSFDDEGNLEEVTGLQPMLLDSDKDGIADKDEAETCVDLANLYSVNCKAYDDPSNRDTNGNGWWDGIEVDMELGTSLAY